MHLWAIFPIAGQISNVCLGLDGILQTTTTPHKRLPVFLTTLAAFEGTVQITVGQKVLQLVLSLMQWHVILMLLDNFLQHLRAIQETPDDFQ